jgi:hypothetical protein
MTKPRFSVFAAVLAIVLLSAGHPLAHSQTADSATAIPALQRRCATVFLASDTPYLPLSFFGPVLWQRAEFQASKLVLTTDPATADALVQLTKSGDHDTRIEVSNRVTGQRISWVSDWTLYPGMVAWDVIGGLRGVCPDAIRSISRPLGRHSVECPKPPAELSSIRSIAGCSHTSWMDSRDIEHALESRVELKQLSVHVVPACDTADAAVEVTHNLDQTVEWRWTMHNRSGTTLATGRVIAFERRDAADRIASVLTREFVLSRENQSQATLGESLPLQPPSRAGRIVNVLLLPTDFSVLDTRTSLYIDAEHAVARDINDRVIFDIPLERVLAVRLVADWRKPYQLADPTPLAIKSVQSLSAALADLGLDPTSVPTAKRRSWPCRVESMIWATIGLTSCPAFDLGKFGVATVEITGYLTAGTVLAQSPPWPK